MGVVLSTPAATIETGRWYHMACTHDGFDSALYLDGTLVQSGAASPISTSNSNGIRLSANSPSGDSLDGALDLTKIWGRALTSDEVCWNHSAGQRALSSP